MQKFFLLDVFDCSRQRNKLFLNLFVTQISMGVVLYAPSLILSQGEYSYIALSYRYLLPQKAVKTYCRKIILVPIKIVFTFERLLVANIP